MRMPQYAVIEQPVGSQFPVIHCPICGTLADGVLRNDGKKCSKFLSGI